jgi:preprotein translocase subunit SecE
LQYKSAFPIFLGLTTESTAMAHINPAQFIREVRQEMSKVTWPTRRETTISTLMVIALVAIAATFFVFVDWVIGTLIRMIIGIG